MIEQGHGVPVVMLPGLQGRWEWMRPAVDALSRRCRVLSFSLGDTPAGAGVPGKFDTWTATVDGALDQAAVGQAVILGHSFGGLVAVRYAASRPDRTAGLVLVSTPSPRHQLDRWNRLFVRHPRLTLPLFLARGATRMPPELIAARSAWGARVGLSLTHLWRTVRWPASPAQMASWVREWEGTDIVSDCALVRAPTLLITGESWLDRIVPTTSTREYLRLIPGSRHVILPGTGHLGPMTKPEEFTTVVADFADGMGSNRGDHPSASSTGHNRGMHTPTEDTRAGHD